MTTSLTDAPVRANVKLRSGALVDLHELDVTGVRVWDIAYALSNQCRFAGSVRFFWSTAGHALYCRRLAIAAGYPHLALEVLHHDSHESLIGDITTPAAVAIGAQGLHDLKRRADIALAPLLGIDLDRLNDPIVRAIDHAALIFEAARLQRQRGRTLARPWPIELDRERLQRVPLPLPGRSRWSARVAFIAAHHHDTKERAR